MLRDLQRRLQPQKRRAFLFLFCLIVWMAVICPAALSMVANRTVEEDTNKDGRTDRIAHLNVAGGVVKLEADTTGDHQMDTFQFYTRGRVVRIERDTDADGLIDQRDLLENEKITLREGLDSKGRIIRVLKFDDQQRPLEWRRDTTGDGRLDTVYKYQAGQLQLVTRDTSGNGRVDVWQHYRNEKPHAKEADSDGDGRIDQKTRFDDQGRPLESRHDLDLDGYLETRRDYQNGVLVRQEKRAAEGATPFVVTDFKAGQAVLEKRDSNGDGAFDILLRMSATGPTAKEEDTNHDGRMDRLTSFDDQGRPLCVRELAPDSDKPVRTSRFKAGTLFSVTQMQEGRLVFIQFENDKPVKQTIDTDQDGQPEQTILFDKAGNTRSATIDTNGDGRTDTWQFYRQGKLCRAEQDRNHDGAVDAKSEYDDGQRIRSLMDADGDGHFETRIAFSHTKYTRVVEVVDKAGRPVQISKYVGEVLRSKARFDPDLGHPVSLEEFDSAGRIVMSKEVQPGTGRLDLTWYYDTGGDVVAGEKDSDGDGATDIWYQYQNGRVVKVEEDRNRDGKPDVWETYDAAQVMVFRSEDLDFDGTADIEKRF